MSLSLRAGRRLITAAALAVAALWMGSVGCSEGTGDDTGTGGSDSGDAGSTSDDGTGGSSSDDGSGHGGADDGTGEGGAKNGEAGASSDEGTTLLFGFDNDV